MPTGEYKFRGEKLRSLASCPELLRADAAPSPAPPQPVVIAMCGSFNPMHKAHISLYSAAKAALVGTGNYVVLGGFVSPVGDAYGKAGLLDFAKRAAIVEVSLQHHAELNIDTWEGCQPTYTRTYYVLRMLEQHAQEWYSAVEPAAPWRQVRVVFACGGDLFSSFLIPKCWPLHLLKQLLERYRVVVVHRDGESENRGNEARPDTENKLAGLLHSSPTLEEVSDSGEKISLRLADYPFLFTKFAVPDNSSSTAVRHVVAALATPGACDSARRAELHEQLHTMVAPEAVQRVINSYSTSPRALSPESREKV